MTDNADIVLNLYRIENVRTTPAERITVNDEERQHQGFDLQTLFRWARRESGHPDVRAVRAEDAEGTIATLRYGPGAEISRLNKGLRRRADQSQHGFAVNPLNGAWAKMDEDDGAEPDPTRTPNQLIVPWVMDRKNALLLQLADESAPEVTVATLQYALKRGIETVYQLEESELLAEPLPDRKSRNGVLFYEATEGGAGVLTRLVHDELALARVAYAALKGLHFDLPAVGEPLPALDDLVDAHGTKCVAGCYRCILSYYNQPDHLVIDRRDRAARALLLRLAAVQTQLLPALDGRAPPASIDPVEQTVVPPTPVVAPLAGGVAAFDAAAFGLPLPSDFGSAVAGVPAIGLWRTQRVVLIADGVDGGPLLDRGLEVVVWPTTPADQANAVSRLTSLLT